MENSFDFDAIRPYRDHELQEQIRILLNEPKFADMLPTFFPNMDIDELKRFLLSLKTIAEFQEKIIHVYLNHVADLSTNGVTLDGLENLDPKTGYVVISNHRDIILDSAFLNSNLVGTGIPMTEIAIGDNLLIYDWIRRLVRINRSFIVERNLPIRQQLESSMRLSAYIRDTVARRNQSVWIAQREGRAKDSNDRTQVALLKMFNMSGSKSLIENFKQLNLCPTSISYEYDPCDYLKAKEFQQKRDDANFKKSPADDLLNMKTGVLGKKGRVRFYFVGDISDQLDEIEAATSVKNEQLTAIADLIDKHIHLNYAIFPNNKVAYDELLGVNRFANDYSEEERCSFNQYIQGQLDKIELPDKDESFLRTKMLEMYANPLINQLKAQEIQ
ncbi:MAG: 1-acyl-sn-glycerol-3-phosphate acyltransferase [Paludibacteraceae bacterium]|nr:1-acyl-sn-glycerol-3-phosphate acyltransferase [Paludibacteraceae bacterium]